MENLTVEAVITSVSIVLLVAVFMLNSGRVQKAIGMCSECLILLNETSLSSQAKSNLFHDFTEPSIKFSSMLIVVSLTT